MSRQVEPQPVDEQEATVIVHLDRRLPDATRQGRTIQRGLKDARRLVQPGFEQVAHDRLDAIFVADRCEGQRLPGPQVCLPAPRSIGLCDVVGYSPSQDPPRRFGKTRERPQHLRHRRQSHAGPDPAPALAMPLLEADDCLTCLTMRKSQELGKRPLDHFFVLFVQVGPPTAVPGELARRPAAP